MKEFLKESPKAAPDIHVEQSPTRCPYCHEQCGPEVDALVCQSCLSRHHQACWTDHGSCSSCHHDQAMERQGQRSHAERCGTCGRRGQTEFVCPKCSTDTCSSCYQDRFRRCIDCATPLLGSVERLRLRKSELESVQGLIALTGLVSGVAAILTVVFAATQLLLGFAIAGAAALVFALVAKSKKGTERKLAREVEELQVELAAYQEPGLLTKATKKFKQLADRFRSAPKDS